jgi:hypothetical protein
VWMVRTLRSELGTEQGRAGRQLGYEPTTGLVSVGRTSPSAALTGVRVSQARCVRAARCALT